jgi:hypothetical protein
MLERMMTSSSGFLALSEEGLEGLIKLYILLMLLHLGAVEYPLELLTLVRDGTILHGLYYPRVVLQLPYVPPLPRVHAEAAVQEVFGLTGEGFWYTRTTIVLHYLQHHHHLVLVGELRPWGFT